MARMYQITPQHEFLVAIDSDGCVFDTMELKHQECFIPNLINSFNLQAVSRYAREVWEFVNLHSRSRGTNRFKGLVETLDWLQRRAEVAGRGVHIEVPESLKQWVQEESRLSNTTLEVRARETADEALERCLAWSLAVNLSIGTLVRNVTPFPLVRDSLRKLANKADMIVCSATPDATLKKEWHEHGIDKYVAQICGQEVGTKREMLANAQKYAPDHALMIGDAPGDYAAAKANACLFFPINPRAEETSWERFFWEGIERFLNGSFAGAYQQKLLDEFEALLPVHPPWKLLPTPGKS